MIKIRESSRTLALPSNPKMTATGYYQNGKFIFVALQWNEHKITINHKWLPDLVAALGELMEDDNEPD